MSLDEESDGDRSCDDWGWEDREIQDAEARQRSYFPSSGGTYTGLWSDRASAYRGEKNWRCEVCGYQAYSSASIHVRSKGRMTASDNFDDLQVICVVCHERLFGRHSLATSISDTEREKIENWQKKKGESPAPSEVSPPMPNPVASPIPEAPPKPPSNTFVRFAEASAAAKKCAQAESASYNVFRCAEGWRIEAQQAPKVDLHHVTSRTVSGPPPGFQRPEFRKPREGPSNSWIPDRRPETEEERIERIEAAEQAAYNKRIQEIQREERVREPVCEACDRPLSNCRCSG